MNSDLLIISNGPGELASWVKSVVKNVRTRKKDLRIIVLLPPCPFSTGQEERIARNISGVDIVLNPKNFFEIVFRGRTSEYVPSKNGLVILLGGDSFHAYFVSKRIGFPSVIYTETASWNTYLNNFFLYCLVSDERIKNKLIKKGTKSDIIRVVGNLLAEGIEVKTSKDEFVHLSGLSHNNLTVGIMPGSRPLMFLFGLSYFLKVSELIKNKVGAVQFILILSPHISMEVLSQAVNKVTVVEGTTGTVEKDDKGIYIKTKEGVIIRITQNTYDAMNCSDLLLTIPGTSNAEAACLGIPMVVCYSFKNPGVLPLGGLPGLIGSVPVIGPFIKYKTAERLIRFLKFLSPPNIITNEIIVPEINVSSEAMEVAEPAIDLLQDNDKRVIMSQKLKNVFNKEGAGNNVASIIIEILERKI